MVYDWVYRRQLGTDVSEMIGVGGCVGMCVAKYTVPTVEGKDKKIKKKQMRSGLSQHIVEIK